MSKKSLMRLQDMALALVLFTMVKELEWPYPRTPAGLWSIHRGMLRTAASGLWLVMLWLNLYPVRDRAKRVSAGTLAAGMALTLGILMIYYSTGLIAGSYKALFSQMLHGGVMLATCASAWALCLGLERNNPDVPECGAASRRCRRALAVDLGVMLAGAIACALKYRQAMWYSVAAAGVWLLVAWIASIGKAKEE